MKVDFFYDFLAGRLSAAEWSAAARAAIDDPYADTSDPERHHSTFGELTHCGVTWQQFSSLLDAFSEEPPGEDAPSQAIRGSGTWSDDPKIRVFLDLDGVVSPIVLSESDSRWRELAADPLTIAGQPPDSGWAEWKSETIDYVPLPPELLNALARLDEGQSVGLAWLTTWEENANWLFEDMALPNRLPVHLLGPDGDGHATKWSTVVAETERNPVPFVWVDDHIGLDAYRWARHHDVDSLVIRTNTFHGITRDCWEHIEAWISEHLGESAAASTKKTTPKDAS